MSLNVCISKLIRSRHFSRLNDSIIIQNVNDMYNVHVYCAYRGTLPNGHLIIMATLFWLKKSTDSQSFSHVKDPFNIARFLWVVGDQINALFIYLRKPCKKVSAKSCTSIHNKQLFHAELPHRRSCKSLEEFKKAVESLTYRYDISQSAKHVLLFFIIQADRNTENVL